MPVSGQTPLIVFEVVVGATLTIAGLSLPLVVAHKAVITRRQLKVMAKWLKRSEEELQSRSFPQERWAEQEREGYAFMVAFRSKARFLRWFYWISILTIPFSGLGPPDVGTLGAPVLELRDRGSGHDRKEAEGSGPRALCRDR